MSKISDKINISVFEEVTVCPEFRDNTEHTLTAHSDINKNVYLKFSTRLAMAEFAKSLLVHAFYGEGGMMEYHDQDGMYANGVRLTDESATLLVFFDTDSPVPEQTSATEQVT